MSNVKQIITILNSRSHLLIIKANSSFTQTFQKIKNGKKIDFIFVKKPKARQMTAVQLLRLGGKRFLWIQGFSNPPKPNLVTRFLLSQSDRLVVDSKEDLEKLKKLGIPKSKIDIISKSP
ncbi:MAG: hypothetical protein NUV69_05710 [Candidatus Curtissbacteria bacterium]|nr:hypothetical protein [Candidatus Curtissbacteria bacterium]